MPKQTTNTGCSFLTTRKLNLKKSAQKESTPKNQKVQNTKNKKHTSSSESKKISTENPKASNYVLTNLNRTRTNHQNRKSWILCQLGLCRWTNTNPFLQKQTQIQCQWNCFQTQTPTKIRQLRKECLQNLSRISIKLKWFSIYSMQMFRFMRYSASQLYAPVDQYQSQKISCRRYSSL